MSEPIPVEGMPAAEGDQHFSREHRIRFRPEFLRIYSEGRRAYGRLAVVFCQPREGGGPWRLGVTVTKKAAPDSVMRNRLRRRVREYFRRSGRIGQGWDLVVNVKAAACPVGAWELWADLDQILARLGVQTPPPPAPAREEVPEQP